MPAVHAPHTMTIAGKVYQGGEFIPAEAQALATPEERKTLGLPHSDPNPTDDEPEDNDEEEEEEEDEEEEPELSETEQFVRDYPATGKTATARLDHALGSKTRHANIDDIDPTDSAFDMDAIERIADDMVEEGYGNRAKLLERCQKLFADHGYGPGDARAELALTALQQMPSAPSTPFKPGKGNAYSIVDPTNIHEHDAEAVRQMLRVGGTCLTNPDGVSIVATKLDGKRTPFRSLLDNDGGMDGWAINDTSDTNEDEDSELAHADLFDSIQASPMVAESVAPRSAKNFGRVSGGQNVEIEPDWDASTVDTYKPVAKGWYLLRRGTHNWELANGDTPMYQFVPRAEAGQLVNLPEPYWESMSKSLLSNDVDQDAADAKEKAYDKTHVETEATARLRKASQTAKAARRELGQVRDHANRLSGKAERARSMETAADEIANLADADAMRDPTVHHPAYQAYLKALRTITNHAGKPGYPAASKNVDDLESKWKEIEKTIPVHPSAHHYDVLQDAVADLHSASPAWSDIDPDIGAENINTVKDNLHFQNQAENRDEHAELVEDAANETAKDTAEAARAAQLAHDGYDDHFRKMHGHFTRVRDAAAAVMPHVADDEARTEALERVKTIADRHLRRLDRAGIAGDNS